LIASSGSVVSGRGTAMRMICSALEASICVRMSVCARSGAAKSARAMNVRFI